EPDRLESEHGQRRSEERGDVGGGRQRRRAKALEDPALSPQHELDREPRERGVRAPVADEPGEDGPHDRHSLVLPRVDRAEQQEQQQREEEDEEGRLAAPTESETLPEPQRENTA